MEWMMEHWKDLLDIVVYVVFAASIVSKFTKNVWDDKVVAALLRMIALIPKSPSR